MRRWIWLGVWVLAGLSALGGCAGSAPTPAAGGDLLTESDETPQHKRARIRLELAVGYFQQGKTTIALDEVKQAVAVDPEFFDAYNLRGLIYMRLGDTGLARESFQRALSLHPADPNVLHNLAWLQCQSGQYAQAVADFERALANPQYTERAKTWMTLGLCQIRSGDAKAAEASLLRSYEYDAANPMTGYQLARLLNLRGERQRAQFYIQRVNASPWANAETLWLGLRIERSLGHLAAAQTLGDQLDKRFAQTPQAQNWHKGAFDE